MRGLVDSKWLMLIVLGFACTPAAADGQLPILKFVSIPDFINMDLQPNDPRLFDLSATRQAALVAEINLGGSQAALNPHVGHFVGTLENGYRGASQVLLEAVAAEDADFLTVSGDMLYTRWPKNGQLGDSSAAFHIRKQGDIYYDAWIAAVEQHGGFDLDDVYTIVGDHEIGDNDWGANKRRLIPTYKQLYVEKLGNESTLAAGAYVAAPAEFAGRTFAVQRGNLLLIGLDQFETFDAAGKFSQASGQISTVKIDVTGAQLAWLEDTLTRANNDPAIDHIAVMGHAPIAGQSGVKVGHSSGLKNATDEDGPLWQTLVSHGVDLFLPGEVHDISVQQVGGVLQVINGTNIFQPTGHAGIGNIGFDLHAPATSEQNYLVVEVYESRIELTLKQIETKIWGSQGLANDPVNDEPYKNRETRVAIETAAAGFQTVGTLTIDKSSGTPIYRNRSGKFLSEWSVGAPIDIDLNHDGVIDFVDAQIFVANFRSDLSVLSPGEAFARGDLNGDRLSDHADFRLFKEAFDNSVGHGAFTAALAGLPEPSSALLTACVILVGLSGNRKMSRRSPRAHISFPSTCAQNR